MATAKEILGEVTKAADWAIATEQCDKTFRAAMFLAYLAGRLQERAPALAAELDRVRTFDGAKLSSMNSRVDAAPLQAAQPVYQQREATHGDR